MEKSNEQLKKENQALKEQVVQLQAMVKLLQNQLFGKKTEVIEKVILNFKNKLATGLK